ncbi:hypothetical protein CNMCM6936_003279 [Aspergillus lentulus]|nr:hypothetical protein CNMCM6936_003279 [Aspergillus lentulus]
MGIPRQIFPLGFTDWLVSPLSIISTDVTVVGVKSGNQFNELNYFANVIHDIESLPSFHFQSFRISHRPLPEKKVKKQKEEQTKEWEKAREKARKVHNKAVKETKNDVERKALGEYKDPPMPPLKAIIPLYPDCVLNFVTLASICITIALAIWSGVQHDAVALLGLGTMALSTSMAFAGDVVIRTRPGAFVSVKCSEEVARELYAGTETCEYVYNGRYHQVLLATSTVLLMAAIIFLSNCGWKIQIAVGLAYIILNLASWAMALLTDPREAWNMEHRYEVDLLEKKDNENYTQVLWDVIRTTGEIRWAKKTGAAPATKNWNGWLKEAKENAHNLN